MEIKLDPWIPTNEESKQMEKDIKKIERSEEVQKAKRSILDGIDLTAVKKILLRTQEIIIKRVEKARNFSIN